MRIATVWSAVVGGLLAAGAMSPALNAETPMHVYLGTYTNPQAEGLQSRGIYHVTFDPETGRLGEPELAGETKNPSFLAVHPTLPVLYAIAETGDFTWQGKPSGVVRAFSIDPATARLTPLGEPRATTGPGPAYVSVTPDGKAVLVANYGGGSVGSLPVNPDGSLGEPSGHVQHTGSGPNQSRQKEPHAHSIVPAPGAPLALAADLGTDEVRVYSIDPQTAGLVPAESVVVKLDPGAGPRHIAFSPDGRFAYVANELSNTVTVFAWNAARPALEKRASAPTLPADFTGQNTVAEIAVTPDGRFVYVSNRGHDSLAIFTRDAATGTLTPAGHARSGGVQPRHFAISPNGQYLLAAYQKTNNVIVFRIDPNTGALEPTGSEIHIGAPVCVRFVREGIFR